MNQDAVEIGERDPALELLKARRPARRAKLPKLYRENQKLLELNVLNLVEKYHSLLSQNPLGIDIAALEGIGVRSTIKLGTEILQLTASTFVREWATRTKGSSATFAE